MDRIAIISIILVIITVIIIGLVIWTTNHKKPAPPKKPDPQKTRKPRLISSQFICLICGERVFNVETSKFVEPKTLYEHRFFDLIWNAYEDNSVILTKKIRWFIDKQIIEKFTVVGKQFRCVDKPKFISVNSEGDFIISETGIDFGVAPRVNSSPDNLLPIYYNIPVYLTCNGRCVDGREGIIAAGKPVGMRIGGESPTTDVVVFKNAKNPKMIAPVMPEEELYISTLSGLYFFATSGQNIILVDEKKATMGEPNKAIMSINKSGQIKLSRLDGGWFLAVLDDEQNLKYINLKTPDSYSIWNVEQY